MLSNTCLKLVHQVCMEIHLHLLKACQAVSGEKLWYMLMIGYTDKSMQYKVMWYTTVKSNILKIIFYCQNFEPEIDHAVILHDCKYLTRTEWSLIKHNTEIAQSRMWGIFIWDTTYSGIFIWDTTYSGIFIWDTTYSGIFIQDTMYSGIFIWDTTYSGIFIRDTTYSGIFIQDTMYSGIFIQDTTYSGIFIRDTTYSGIFIRDTTYSGIFIRDTMYSGIFIWDTTYSTVFQWSIRSYLLNHNEICRILYENASHTRLRNLCNEGF